jgi:hypothetical protein
MSQPILFEPPLAFQQRVQELAAQQEMTADQARTLLNVELTLALAEFLGFTDEPVTALWALLSGMPLREPRLMNLDAAQRQALANVRQIVPYGPRFAWKDALRDYLAISRLSPTLCSYYFELSEPLATIVDAARKPAAQCNELHADICRRCLTERLPWHHREAPQPVVAGQRYQFAATAQDEARQLLHADLTVEFEAEPLAQLPSFAEPWFAEPLPKKPVVVSWPQLREVAEYLDEQDTKLAKRYPGYSPQNWMRRLSQMNLQLVTEDGLVATEEVRIDQFMHIAGMVASGKSTLSMLLAAYLIQHEPARRLTLVVGDVQSAIQLANQLNSWFRHDPAAEEPVAVPLLGRSTRVVQQRGFLESADYLRHSQRQQPHWGERWLSPLCPLQANLSEVEVKQRLGGHLLQAGKEPCQTLRKVKEAAPRPRARRAAALPDPTVSKRRHACPYLPVCPQYQLYRDMPGATVWVTTPGALAGSTLPVQLEDRPLKLGEFVYERSDLVIFDEADTIIQWFDNQYAQELRLTGGRVGILDTITLPTESHAVGSRVMPGGTLRWVGAERSAQQAVTSVLTLLHGKGGPGFLAEWVQQHQFTPLSLCYRLARLLAGVPATDSKDARRASEEERQRYDAAAQQIMPHFTALLEESDGLRLPQHELPAPVRQLGQLLQRINSTGENATDPDIHAECQQWIRTHCPKARPPATESLPRLAYRLQFALTVALLDRHTRIVFYEWDNRPAAVQTGSPAYRTNAAVQSLLPLPLTGRQFGTYYAQSPPAADHATSTGDQALSVFAYTNVGRYYVLHFHELFTDLTGLRGPAVLAMSGTSYLEDSTAFHVSRPQALLLPAPDAVAAIRQSTFGFLPQCDYEGKPIRLSGARQPDKPLVLETMVRGLVGREGRGQLGQQLATLARLGVEIPNMWHDRQRLLLFVNSYDQAQWAAEELRRRWPALQSAIRHLVSGKEEPIPVGGLLRTDIEQFAYTGGQILVAPLNAVGRGFNILNAAGNAAFGAVYFLTRPYPHLHDVQAVAQEMNRRTFDWQADADFGAWQEDGLQGKAEAARRLAVQYWRLAESRSFYSTLQNEEDLRAYPRRDLAATTIGYVIQAVGRLLRGGVPFHAFFVDAAWGPKCAESDGQVPDMPSTSLLAAMIELLTDYVADDFISRELYEPLAYALDHINDFTRESDPPKPKKSSQHG